MKVEKLLRSKDEVVHSAEVRVLSEDNKKTVVLRRPIQHLIPIEVQITSEVQDTSEVKDTSEGKDTSEEVENTDEVNRSDDQRPRRLAAVKGELIRRKYRWR